MEVHCSSVSLVTVCLLYTSRELLAGECGELVVTPREIDALIADAAGIIATAVNRALQPDLSQEEIMAMMD